MPFPTLTRILPIWVAFVSTSSVNCHLLMFPAGPVNFFLKVDYFSDNLIPAYHLLSCFYQKPESHSWWPFLLCSWHSINHQVLSTLPPKIYITSLHLSVFSGLCPIPRSPLYYPCLKFLLATIRNVNSTLQNQLVSTYLQTTRSFKCVSR